jgi:trehalose-6-phosphate synthase
VNRKFAAVLLDEMSGESEPIVLVQDYHFALLPRMIKERRPDARVAIFWHIPWPNPEAFRDLPLAARTAGRHAGRGPDRIPHSGALQ